MGSAQAVPRVGHATSFTCSSPPESFRDPDPVEMPFQVGHSFTRSNGCGVKRRASKTFLKLPAFQSQLQCQSCRVRAVQAVEQMDQRVQSATGRGLILGCCEQFDFHTVPERTVFWNRCRSCPFRCLHSLKHVRGVADDPPKLHPHPHVQICRTDLEPSMIGILIVTMCIPLLEVLWI